MRTASVLIRCDGSQEIGFGHVMRCLALADALAARGARVAFAVRSGPVAASTITARGFDVVQLNDSPEPARLSVAATKAATNIMVVDVRDATKPGEIAELRAQGMVTAVIDDFSDRRLAADFSFMPPVPQAATLSWNGAVGKHYVGWEWILLHRDFAERPLGEPHATPRVFVTGGGSDPRGLSVRFCEALARVPGTFETVVVTGPGFHHDSKLRSMLDRLRGPSSVHHAVTRMAPLMASCDMALASFGTTAYELAAIGVPAVYLCISDDHARSADLCANAGTAINLGVTDRASIDQIVDATAALLADEPRRRAMAARGRELVDGRGADRVAQLLLDQLDARQSN